MRAPSDLPRRPRRGSVRARVAVIIAIVVVIVLLTSLRGIAGFWTDYLWFQNLGFGSVFTGILTAKIVLGVVFCLIVFAFLLANLVIADRIAPRGLGPHDELVVRYREAVGGHAGKVRLAVAALFALILGVGQSSQWSAWILYRNAQNFGVKDPQFHRDIGYYVFKLPFLQNLVGWAFGMVLLVTFVTTAFHYLNGGIKLQTPTPGPRVTPQVKAHVSVLLGILALIKGAGYYLQRYSLVDSTRGFVKGALYTDVHAQLPAFNLLMVISLIAFVLLMVNIYLRGWTLPALGVGLWFLVSIAAGAIYPAVIQRYVVKPVENNKERPYIQRNIQDTRDAYGLASVTSQPFAASTGLTAEQVTANAATIRNIRLWDPDPSISPQTFSQEQSLRQYYKITDTDVDRYNLNGTETQTLLSVRELDQNSIPSGKSWVNEHLQYTHGYGAVLAPANAVTTGRTGGDPVYNISGVPVVSAPGAPQITQPAIYFGESPPDFSIVDTTQPEFDFDQSGGATQTTSYAGAGGVKMSSFFRRAAFALRFSDLNVLISGAIKPNSRILYIRNIQARIHKVAPFLKLDADPYAAIVNGRVVWVLDAYTTTDRYPYAQDYNNPGRLDSRSGLNTSFNYVRNSVKATVDAYDGSVTLYITDPSDPIVNAWKSAFPSLFKPKSAVSNDLAAHFRYPEDLFRVQTDIWGRYHIKDALAFYNASDAWNPAQDPGVGNQVTSTNTTLAPVILPNGKVAFPTGIKEQAPFYGVMQLPNQDGESFVLLQPMVAIAQQATNQQNLIAFMVAQSDPGTYGQLSVYTTPGGSVRAPAQVNSLMLQDTNVSKDISLFNQGGSEALVGNVLTIPINQSLLYVRPLYISSKSTTQALPELKKVIVVYNGAVFYEDTLQAALQDAFPGLGQLTQEQTAAGATTTTTTAPPTSGPPPPAGNQTVAQLLQAAQQDFTNANAALAKNPPDFATYQKDIQDAQAKIAEALQQSGGSPASTTTTAPASTTTTVAAP